MPRARLGEMTCSIARTLDVIGERWTPLILRDVFGGVTRFDAIQDNLGIPRKVLTQRLESLIERGVLQRAAYQSNPPRHDYVLTEKGRDLAPVLLSMMAWGDRWEAGPAGPPVQLRHHGCGEIVDAVAACSNCGQTLAPDQVSLEPGPGVPEDLDSPAVPVQLARMVSQA